jgi:hypothetical protein
MSDAIDAYLDELLVELHGRAREVRRILVEAEQHLRDAADEGVRSGLAADEAARAAVERFGSARLVARRFAAEAPPVLSARFLGQVGLALVLLGGVGLVAVGVSGGVAAGMGSAFGKTFVSGDSPDVAYTPARCAYFLEYYPRPTCEQAATAHHYDEVVFYRLAAGLAGLVALGGWWLARRRGWFGSGEVGLLPESFVPTIGAAVFGLAAAGLLAQGFGQIVVDTTNGAGEYVSGGLVSLAVAAWFVRSLVLVFGARTGGSTLATS